MSRRALALVPAAALLLVLALVPLPVFTLGPGPAREVLPLIEVDGAVTYAPKGKLLLTTVGFDRPTVIEAVWAWADPDTDVVPEEVVIPPDLTDEEYERLSLADMSASQIAATAAALRSATNYPERRREGGLIQDVFPGSPADGRLRPGDVILSVDGADLTDFSVLEEAVRRAGTDGEVVLRVKRGEKTRTVRLSPRTIASSDRPVIGVVVVENFPFDVHIESGEVGGPSAGLMWALALVDVLEPGELTGGRTVAGTGEIDPEGRVLAVGGVGFKVLAAERAGADVFLVPADNLAEARAAAVDIRVIPVSTLAGAIEDLGAA